MPGLFRHPPQPTQKVRTLLGQPAAPIERTAADSLTFSDEAARVGTFLRAPSDSLTFSDEATRLGTFLRAVSDSLTFSDAATRVVTAIRTAADSLTFSDSATRLGTFLRTGADSLTFSDSATRVGTFIRTAADSLTFSDTAAAVKLIIRSAADSLTFSDTATRLGTFVRTAADSLTFSDSAARVLTAVRTATDSLTFSDAATRTGTFLRTAADSLTFSDVADAVKVIARSAVDSLAFSDSATRVVTLVRTAADSLTTSDAATRAVTVIRTAADSLTFSDVANRAVTVVRSAADSLTFADSAAAALVSALAGITGPVGIAINAFTSGIAKLTSSKGTAVVSSSSWANSGSAPITLRQSAQGTSGTPAFASPTQANSLVLVVLGSVNAAAQVTSSGFSDVYGAAFGISADVFCRVFAKYTAGDSGSYAIDASIDWTAFEFSGLTSGTALSPASVSNQGPNTHPHLAFMPSGSSPVLVTGSFVHNNTTQPTSADSGFSIGLVRQIGASNKWFGLVYKIDNPNAGSYDPGITATGSGTWGFGSSAWQ